MANFFNQKVKTLFTRFDSDKVFIEVIFTMII